MDRSMVERIEEPLVHLVRNAMDHGVETAAERKAAGKAGRATLRLAAYHEGGSIVVELSDDGRGLQRDAILARARREGARRPRSRTLDDQEICNLHLPAGLLDGAGGHRDLRARRRDGRGEAERRGDARPRGGGVGAGAGDARSGWSCR